MNENTDIRFTVYYDGSCNACNREIGFYMGARGAEAIRFVDITDAEPDALGRDVTPEQALEILHARNEAGDLLRGVEAFLALWQRLPALRWLGRLGDKPGIRHCLELGYRLFLAWRRRFPSPAQCRLDEGKGAS